MYYTWPGCNVNGYGTVIKCAWLVEQKPGEAIVHYVTWKTTRLLQDYPPGNGNDTITSEHASGRFCGIL